MQQTWLLSKEVTTVSKSIRVSDDIYKLVRDHARHYGETSERVVSEVFSAAYSNPPWTNYKEKYLEYVRGV
jgi:hypothetical protein